MPLYSNLTPIFSLQRQPLRTLEVLILRRSKGCRKKREVNHLINFGAKFIQKAFMGSHSENNINIIDI
jgi:hypothetical protein